MSETFFERNKRAYDFLLSHEKRIEGLCEPLKILRLSFFAYCRFFRNGDYFSLLNNLKYRKKYLECIRDTGDFVTGIISKCLHKNSEQLFLLTGPLENFNEKKDPVAYLLHSYGIWNLFAFYRKCPDDSVECFNFSGNMEDAGIPKFCLENLDILKDYMRFFKSKAGDLIDTTDKTKLAHYERSLAWSKSISDERSITCFQSTMLKENRVIEGPDGLMYSLSPREWECAKLLSEKCKIKDIARIMRISPRTVEDHLEKIRKKTGHLYTNEIAKAFF